MLRLCCRWHVHVNSLWLWWYATIVLAGHSYLMYRAVQQCKEYNELPWRSAEKPVAELYIYIILLVISMMCLPFFVITAVFKVGNYANDGVRLGRDDLDPSRLREDGGTGDNREGQPRTEARAQTVWKHLAPLCNTFHVVAAFALLLPKVLLDAQKIAHQFLPAGDIWLSELDIVFGSNRPVAYLADISAARVSNTNQTLPSTIIPPTVEIGKYVVVPISPEFVNWVLALIIYSLRYPAVYWYTKKTFSMIFAFLLFAALFQYMFSYCAMGILYKYQANTAVHPDLVLVLPYQILIILYLLTNTFVFISSISLFNYGYYHYNESFRKFLAQNGMRRTRNKIPTPVGCQGYVPHSIATITLMLFVASRATVVYDAVSIYRNSSNKVMLASIVWDVSYMLIWIITWFAFTIKQSWGFKVRASVLAETSNEVYTIRNQHARDSTILNSQQLPNGEDVTDSPEQGQGAVTANDDIDPNHRDSPPNSPTSAMRKSGERRSGERRSGNVHVTFEEDDMDPGEDNIARGSPRRRSRDKSPSRKKRNADGGDALNDRGAPPPVPHKQDRPLNVFGNYPLEETPENTLTRSYRHSIRDKCGQYYRASREFQSPPAAQSSPVLGQRQPDRSSGSYLPRDQGSSRDSSHDLPSSDLPPRDLPPRKPRGDHSHQRRSGSYEPERPPRPEPRKPSQPKPQQALPQVHSKNPPVGGERVLPPLPSQSKPQSQASGHPMDVYPRNKPRPNSVNYNQSQISPTNYVLNDVINYPAGMVRNNLNAKQQAATARDSGRSLNREIRLAAPTSKKPDMGRRDSALPSSNETSSNDSSENVLCSQV